MDALEAANDLLGTAILDHSNGHHERGDRLTAQAQTFAAIAQAEQLKRIADALDNLTGGYIAATFGMYPPVAEGIINPEEQDPIGPSPLDNY